MNTIYIKPDEPLKNLARKLFGYTGRKFQLTISEKVGVNSNWEGGSHTDTVLVNRKQLVPATIETRWFDPDKVLTIPPGYFVIERRYFCGKDMGIRVVVRPDEADTAMLPAKTELTAPEKYVLETHCCLKSFARKEQIERVGLLDRWEEIKESLQKKGMMMKNGAVTPEGRNNRLKRWFYGIRFEGDTPINTITGEVEDFE